MKRLFWLLVLALTLTGCAGREERPGDWREVYTQAVLESENVPGTSFGQKMPGPTACLDVQALPGLEAGLKGVFIPQCLVTVVLAIDREQTDLQIRDWKDLEAAGLEVGLPNGDFSRRLVLGALAYGLDGELRSPDSALSFLRSLEQQGNLSFGTEDCPVTVCFDIRAVQRLRAGENLELTVPRTLSYRLGLLGKEAVEGAPEDTLLDLGFRLTDGRCGYALDYSRAHTVEDHEGFRDVTEATVRNIRRQVLHTRYLAAASGLEAILFAVMGGVLAIFWGAWAGHRSTREDLRHCAWGITGMMVGWLLVRMIKYELPDGLVTRLLWYSYYIFLMGLPLILLYIAAVVDRPWPRQQNFPRWFLPFLLTYPVLLGLVLTNDLHMLVFRFDFQGDWSGDYSYGPGYFTVLAYCVGMLGISLVMLLTKARKRPWGWIWPLGVVGLLLIYTLGYIRRVPLFRDSDLTLVFCALSILFMEAVLNNGMLPTNTHYKALFSESPLSMQILDAGGETVLRASHAQALTREQRQTVLDRPGEAFFKDENTRLHSRPIRGGTVIWQEDVTELSALQARIRTSVERLQAANALLRRDGQIRRGKMEARIQKELFDLLEQDMAERTTELSRLIRELPESPDRQAQIAYLTLLLCQIKRRCNLFFLSRESRWMKGDELSVYLDELSEFASYAGVHALVRSRLPEELTVSRATVCYDFYFFLLSWSVQRSHATLVGQLESRDPGLSFKVWSSEVPEGLMFPSAFRAAVTAAGGTLSERPVDDTRVICLVIGGSL